MENTMSDSYSVALLGLGRIAATYGSSDNANAYCHSAGLVHCPRVHLGGVADPMPAARDAYRAEWGQVQEGYVEHDSFAELWAERPCDIVTVCVRGPDHFALMNEVIAARPRHIILEKPPTCSLEEADALVAAAAAAGIGITVSYSRHWHPQTLHLAGLVRDGLIGEVRHVISYGDVQVLSACSHAMDALCQFAGQEPVAVSATGCAEAFPSQRPGYLAEPSLAAATVEFSGGATGSLIGGPGEHGVFYLEALGERGFVRCGMYTDTVVVVDGEQRDYAAFNPPQTTSPFTQLYRQVAEFLDGGPAPECTNEAWHSVNALAFASAESICTQARVPLAQVERSTRIFANG
jgi:predicted dehydrogenase